MSQKIFNLILLDESGSMSIIEKAAVGGINETLQSIRQAQQQHPDQEHFVTLATFHGGSYTVKYDRNPAPETKDLERYNPGGSTPLFDAMGRSITELRSHVCDDDAVLVTIITDGEENSSVEYSGQAIKQLVSEMRNQGWVFSYIGTNQDVDAVADQLGIHSRMNYDYSDVGMQDAIRKERKQRMVMYSRIANEGTGFFKDDPDYDYLDNSRKPSRPRRDSKPTAPVPDATQPADTTPDDAKQAAHRSIWQRIFGLG